MGHMRLERVTDFENAKMDRRRLIKALGAGAAAAFAAKGLPEHIARDCNGRAADCRGGSRG